MLKREIALFSLNCRGLRDSVKRKSVFTMLIDNSFDVICLQEAHVVEEDVLIWKKQWPGYLIAAPGDKRSRGCIVLFKQNKNLKIDEILIDEEGRYIVCVITIYGLQIIVVNVYGPNRDSPEFYQKLTDRIEKLNLPSQIWMGDFNVALDVTLDRSENKEYNVNAKEKVIEIMQKWELVDVWRIKNPKIKLYSWKKSRNSNIGSRIDNCLISDTLAGRVKEVFYISNAISDHMGMKCVVQHKTETRGPGLWKLNVKLFENYQYYHDMEKLIKNIDFLEGSEDDILEKWEWLKYQVKLKSRDFAKELAKNKRANLEQMQHRLADVDLALLTSPANRTLMYLRNEITNDIQAIYDEKARQSLFRSRLKWSEEGEKCTKYFFAIEKERYNRKTMSLIKDESGQWISDGDKILAEQAKFYRNLYSKDANVKFVLINESDVKLTAHQSSELDRPISKEEIKEAVFQLKKDKTPGLDGIPIDFYQQFWNVLGEKYELVLENIIDQDTLNRSARRGCITLLPKKGKDPAFLKNWRPITLLNSDYKILAKIIANRIKSVLADLISLDQTGFMSGCQITTTIRKTMDVADYCDKYDQPGYIVCLDFQKCFDSIDYSAIEGALKYFGFGTYIIQLVNLLLKNFWSCTCNNGFTSNYFRIDRSCHQGDPVAAYLYLLCGEVMALSIKKAEKTRGLSIYDLEQIISQFADDTQLFGDGKEVIENYITVLDTIYLHTGLTVNYDKSSIHCIGGAKELQLSKDFVWSTEKPNILGVNTGIAPDIAFDEITNKVQEVCNKWYNQKLSLMGKVLLVNTLMGSLYVYKMFVFPSPSQKYIDKFMEIIDKFLWNNKRPKIKQSILNAKKTNGGLGLINMKAKLASLKISWLFREDIFVQNWIESIVPHEIGSLFLYCNLSINDLDPYIQNLSVFWHQVLEEWFLYSYVSEIDTKEQVVNQIIWYNSLIRIDDNVLANPVMINRGLLFISDLLDDSQCNFKSLDEVKEHFGPISWLEYKQIISAIPRNWKIMIKKVDCEPLRFINKYDELKKEKKVVGKVYSDIVSKNDACRILFEKMNTKLNLDKTDPAHFKRFKDAFANLYKICKTVKFRDF